MPTKPEPVPHWRRDVEPSEHNRTWVGLFIAGLVTFAIFEIPALGRKVLGDTASEWVWNLLPPLTLRWWLAMSILWGFCVWLCLHFAFRWGGFWALLGCIPVGFLLLAASTWLRLRIG